MPLRVAEVNGLWLKGVNECNHCPYARQHPGKPWRCEHPDLRMKEHEFETVQIGFIPIWCPLPNPLNAWADELPKTMTEFMIRQENAEAAIGMRGKHPENIVWDEPAVFIVEDVDLYAHAMDIVLKPEFPNGPDWTCLRKDDWLRADHSTNYLVLETPTSSRIRVNREPKLNKGDRLIANGPAREEKRSNNA